MTNTLAGILRDQHYTSILTFGDPTEPPARPITSNVIQCCPVEDRIVRSYGAFGEERHHRAVINAKGVSDVPAERSEPVALSRFEQATTLVAVIELSQSSWLIAGTVPGIERQPLKKIVPDETELLRVLHRWREEAIRKGHTITRIAVAFEAGRDGFWLARWLTGQGSRSTSSIRAASRSRASTSGPRRIGSTPRC